MPGLRPESAGLTLAERFHISGRVQGIGLRPAVARWAAECGLTGMVRNTPAGVEIVVEGHAAQLSQFAAGLTAHLPAAAVLDSIDRQPAVVRGLKTFTVNRNTVGGPLAAEAPRDVAACAPCLQEVADSTNRRHNYPFASCTNCGPRYSIIRTMPYERSATTMAQYPLCARCRWEYESASDRRFHAQTNACAVCGPNVWCVDRHGHLLAEREAAIEMAVRAILAGQIVAVRGLGGYQLLCDATSNAAVADLRQRKDRPDKPLAVMVASLTSAREWAVLDAVAEDALTSPANPIVIVPVRHACRLPNGLHPGLQQIGLLLPTTPLHWLLLRGVGRPIVATSGNREGEPLAFEIESSEDRLASIADLWLHHDRPIHRPVDDSVVRIIAGRPVTLRLARGLAPLRLALAACPPMLALGGHQKSAVAVSNGTQAVLGPHIGDLDNGKTFDRFLAQQAQLCDLFGASPELLIHDLHPDYASTDWAAQQPLLALQTQHHHTHVVAGMLEHGWLDREVLGVAWDGTGYGGDGTVWGGEFLIATSTSFRRVAHLRPFPLAGGEEAVRQPWRVAAALVRDALGEAAAMRLQFPGISTERVKQVVSILDHRRFSPLTTSAGRLFDAVAALTLGLADSAYEGFPAMRLESACETDDDAAYPLPLGSEPIPQLDWRPMIAAMIKEQAMGKSAGSIARRFHHTLAESIVSVCRRHAHLPVVLAGGVFQNRVLTEHVVHRLQARGQSVGCPGSIPPGDGGLAAGQLAIAAARTSRPYGPDSEVR